MADDLKCVLGLTFGVIFRCIWGIGYWSGRLDGYTKGMLDCDRINKGLESEKEDNDGKAS